MKMTLTGLRRFLTVLLAAALIVPTFYVAPAVAVGSFTGGPMPDSAIYVPNDHTTIGLRWSAGSTTDTTITTGLEPNTTYYMKIRLSPVDGTGANDERGWTFNNLSGRWVWVRDTNWPDFESFTTDELGRIDGGHDVWSYFKFGSDDFMNAEVAGGGYRYYLFIALSTGKGGTLNSTNGPETNGTWPVTVLDMRTGAARIHNGVTISNAFKRVEATAVDATTTVYSVSQTELNGVDDDSNGVVDDEDYGPSGSPGDFMLGVPTGIPMNVLVQRQRKYSSYTAVNPDEDIAMGVADQSAPTSPTVLVATPGDMKIDLTWSASTDNVGVDHYNIYRWEIPVLSSPTFSQPPVLIATSTVTSYTDDSEAVRTGGKAFGYEVRAVDTATNVSARSDEVEAVSQASPPTLNVSVAPEGPDGNDGWYITTPTVVLSTDPGATAYYAWDSDTIAFTAYSEPLSVPDGVHTLTYYAEDQYGNQSPTHYRPFKVDSQAPTTMIVVPEGLLSNTSTRKDFWVSWSGSDPSPSSGAILHYDVDYRVNKSGDWRPWKVGTSATTAKFRSNFGYTYEFRVRAHDLAGNAGSYAESKSVIVPYDQDWLYYGGGWSAFVASPYYQGSVRYTSRNGGWTSAIFYGGKAVYLIATEARTRGRVKVYIDGHYERTVDLYSASNRFRKGIYLGNLSGTGKHVVKLVNVWTGGRRVLDIDGFAVVR